ncbi:hypothetical protein ACFJGW_17450 [Burkholderiaceae bacterium UC74_6]
MSKPHKVLIGAVMLLAALGISLWMAGCAYSPTVYAVGDLAGDAPNGVATGRFEALGTLMGSARKLRLVFVHGVSDHCPGYALGQDQGWLSQDNLRALHMAPTDGRYLTKKMVEKEALFIPASYIQSGAEKSSGVYMAKREYVLDLPVKPDQTPVRIEIQAIEITWSPLTQWVKRLQLSYDARKAMGDSPCSVQVSEPTGLPAPERMYGNQVIKEETLDLRLSDAILYVGSYGPLMEKGVAEALCHAVTGNNRPETCKWPSQAQEDADPYRYMFVTHSLGSRIVYDLLLNMQGYETTTRRNGIDNEVLRDAKPFTQKMLSQINGVYMMANQLPLLGLANFGPLTRATGGAVAYAAEEVRLDSHGNIILPESLPDPNIDKPKPLATVFQHTDGAPSFNLLGIEDCNQPFQAIALSRDLHEAAIEVMDARTRRNAPQANFSIVAFNDTNDLLTWHLPNWYAGINQGNCAPSLDIANVFVKNTWQLPALLEFPTDAHVGYFKNPAVWQAIACGAEGGKLKSCLAK